MTKKSTSTVSSIASFVTAYVAPAEETREHRFIQPKEQIKTVLVALLRTSAGGTISFAKSLGLEDEKVIRHMTYDANWILIRLQGGASMAKFKEGARNTIALACKEHGAAEVVASIVAELETYYDAQGVRAPGTKKEIVADENATFFAGIEL